MPDWNPTGSDSDLEAILHGEYACTRDWSAWQVGTMTQNDFTPMLETEIVSDLLAWRDAAAKAASRENGHDVEDATTRLMSALALHEDARDFIRDALQDAYDAGREAALNPPLDTPIPSRVALTATMRTIDDDETFLLDNVTAIEFRQLLDTASGIDRPDDGVYVISPNALIALHSLSAAGLADLDAEQTGTENAR